MQFCKHRWLTAWIRLTEVFWRRIAVRILGVIRPARSHPGARRGWCRARPASSPRPAPASPAPRTPRRLFGCARAGPASRHKIQAPPARQQMRRHRQSVAGQNYAGEAMHHSLQQPPRAAMCAPPALPRARPPIGRLPRFLRGSAGRTPSRPGGRPPSGSAGRSSPLLCPASAGPSLKRGRKIDAGA